MLDISASAVVILTTMKLDMSSRFTTLILIHRIVNGGTS